jgi:hypothetical protein
MVLQSLVETFDYYIYIYIHFTIHFTIHYPQYLLRLVQHSGQLVLYDRSTYLAMADGLSAVRASQ